MPRISLAVSEIIKRRLFRAREHLECCGGEDLGDRMQVIAYSAFEIAFGLGLPAVNTYHSSPSAVSAKEHFEDALRNLTTIIDFDLTKLDFTRDPEEVVAASQALMAAVHLLPLPAQPPARSA